MSDIGLYWRIPAPLLPLLSQLSWYSGGPPVLRTILRPFAPMQRYTPYPGGCTAAVCVPQNGFSPMCFTSHRSLQFSRRWISSAPHAIRAGWAGCPLLINWAAYRSSATSQGTSAASLTQSFSGASFPYGNTKFSISLHLLYHIFTAIACVSCGLRLRSSPYLNEKHQLNMVLSARLFGESNIRSSCC